mmetsp:Transcript_18090/g.49941  ORF Transcript_18090/g.49941 Transcript_18090/m.49941 type:complete len:204 (+) Transcript_18090:514-1125(+)
MCILILPVHAGVNAQDLAEDESGAGLLGMALLSRLWQCVCDGYILPDVLRPHVLRCIKAEPVNAAGPELLQVSPVHRDDLRRSAPQLGPLAAAPALHAHGPVPLAALQLEPRPLEVIPAEGGRKCLVEPALQVLQEAVVVLGPAPLIAGCHYLHVVEDDIADDPQAVTGAGIASLAQFMLTAEAMDILVPQGLVPRPPLIAVD